MVHITYQCTYNPLSAFVRPWSVGTSWRVGQERPSAAPSLKVTLPLPTLAVCETRDV